MYLMLLIAIAIIYSVYVNNKTLLYASLLSAVIYAIFYKKENFSDLVQRINESPRKMVLIEKEIKRTDNKYGFNNLNDIYKDNALNMYFSNLKKSIDEVDTICNNPEINVSNDNITLYNSLLEFYRKDECRKSFYSNNKLKLISLTVADIMNEEIKNEIIDIYIKKYFGQGNYIIPVIINNMEYYYQIGKNIFGQPVIQPYTETVNNLGIKLYQNVNTLLFYKVMNA